MGGATEVVVLLTGAAASDAQHLAAEFVDQGLAVSPLNEDELAQRSVGDLAVGAVVGFVVNAAYDLAASTVRRWLASRGHSDDTATVTPAIDQAPQESDPSTPADDDSSTGSP